MKNPPPIVTRPRSVALAGAIVVLLLAVSAAGAPPCHDNEYIRRRARVLEELERLETSGKTSGGRAILLVRSPSPARFAGDVDFPFRPNNTLYYLTGIGEPNTALLLAATAVGELGREVLFLAGTTEFDTLWNGPRTSVDEAASISGVPRASILVPPRVPGMLGSSLALSDRQHHHHHGGPLGPRPVLFFDPGQPFEPGGTMGAGYHFLVNSLGSAAFRLDLREPRRLLDPMREIKSDHEVALLQRAIDATCIAHRRAMRLARPGLHEYHLAAEIEATFRKEGCSGWAFPSIVGSGPNSCVLHYQRYQRQLEDGDLVVMDIGGEFGHYAADVTRTIPVGGRFSDRQKAVYSIVLDAQDAVFRAIRPGLTLPEINRIAQDVVGKGLVDLGLIKTPQEAQRYLPHGVTHGVGLAVHDPIVSPELKAGMVITVEPGIYIPEEELGIRIEDDVLVTEDGHRVLSLAAPRTLEEVERAMNTDSF